MDQPLLSGLRALVDVHRVRIVGRLAQAPADAGMLARELRQPLPSIRRHLQALEAVGLVEPAPDLPGHYRARLDRVGELGRGLAGLEAEAAGRALDGGGEWPHEGESLQATIERLGLTSDEMKVLRSYLVDGRLVTIPAQGRKRQVILRFLLERVFTEDRPYPEKEVNQRLALFHPDPASLRRSLYDGRYVDREAGIYTRTTPRAGD